MAALELLNFSTATTPAKLFQMATRRSDGQGVARWASSFRLSKVSNGVAVVAAASSVVPNAVIFALDSQSDLPLITDCALVVSPTAATNPSLLFACLSELAARNRLEPGDRKGACGRTDQQSHLEPLGSESVGVAAAVAFQ